MKNQINRYLKYCSFCICTLVIALSACSPMDEYKDIAGEEEIQYTGKIDSVKVFSGDERLLITGLFISDPKVTNCRIYWNLRNDSVDIPVNKTSGIDTLKKEISLPENTYNFEIYTYDALGNKSVPVYATGRTYGKDYKASLVNRRIVSSKIDSDSIIIEWGRIDLTLNPLATEVTYTTNEGSVYRKRTDINNNKTVLKNYKSGTEVNYSTLYLPESLCIDTFRTQIELVKIE